VRGGFLTPEGGGGEGNSTQGPSLEELDKKSILGTRGRFMGLEEISYIGGSKLKTLE